MPSKYILTRLAMCPFAAPARSKTRLRDEFITELDVGRANTFLSRKQELDDWTNQAEKALMRAASAEAKKYVWNEFAHAQNASEEPELFKVAYAWLSAHRQWAPQRHALFLNWQHDAFFSCSSLLCAASHLPDDHAVQYIAQWLGTQQKALVPLGHELPGTPVQCMRMRHTETFLYDERKEDTNNKALWTHVLVPACTQLPEALLEYQHVPNLPYIFDASFVEMLLQDTPAFIHPWVLSNALFPKDFYKSILDDEHIVASLATLTSTLLTQEQRAFSLWDLLHRQDDAKKAKRLVDSHFPAVGALLDALGMQDIETVRNAMLSQWNTTMSPLETMALPYDME